MKAKRSKPGQLELPLAFRQQQAVGRAHLALEGTLVSYTIKRSLKRRAISILVDDTLPATTVRATIREAAADTLVRVREFDRYQGKGVPEGKVSLSLRLVFRSPERTLTDAEVQSAMDALLAALREQHGAVQR